MTNSGMGGRATGLLATLACSLVLTACGDGGTEAPAAAENSQNPANGTDAWLGTPDTSAPSASVPSTSPAVAPPADAPVPDAWQIGSAPALPDAVVAPSVNGAPVVGGQPSTSLSVGVAWSFVPSASDPNGDTLTFSISGQPSWASFDATTGTLSGTPSAEHMGSYANIVITASDGSTSSSLEPFSLLVSATTPGSATLTWTPPSTNTDGSSLTNLSGYRIYYGTDQSNLGTSVQVAGAGMTSYTVGNLTPGTYYFTIAAYTSDGIEGERSSIGSKSIM